MSENPPDNDAASKTARDDRKFFVSYAGEDRQSAEALFRALKKKRIQCWIDKRDIDPGAKFSGKIVEAIDQSAGVILLLSEYSNRSEWVEREVGLAASQGKALFPVEIAPVRQLSKELVLHISGRQNVNLVDRPFKSEELDHLADALRKVLRSEKEKQAPRQLAADSIISPDAGSKSPATPKKAPPLRPESPLRRMGKIAQKRFLVFKALAFTAACASTWWMDAKIADNDPASVIAQRLFSIAAHYQFLVTSGPRKPEPGHVFLIEISGVAGVSDRNTCKERRYIGDLLATLAPANPKVVVIDKYFDDDPCGGATGKLIQGAGMLCQARAKVVVGRGVNDDALDKGSIPYPLDPALDFKGAGAGCVTEGLVNIDPDFRRVDLWFPDVQHVHDSSLPPPSLALAAALAYQGDLDVASLPYTAEPRYVSFLAPEQFDKFKRNASEVLCGARDAWRACESKELRPDVKTLAQGNVVVIGEFDHRDRHKTVLGELDGYLLQANYIESLIDNRLIKPVPEWVDWTAALMAFVCFEYLTRRLRRVKLLAASAGLPAGLWLITYVAVNNAGYYLNPAPVTVLAILYSRAIEFVFRKK